MDTTLVARNKLMVFGTTSHSMFSAIIEDTFPWPPALVPCKLVSLPFVRCFEASMLVSGPLFATGAVRTKYATEERAQASGTKFSNGHGRALRFRGTSRAFQQHDHPALVLLQACLRSVGTLWASGTQSMLAHSVSHLKHSLLEHNNVQYLRDALVSC